MEAIFWKNWSLKIRNNGSAKLGGLQIYLYNILKANVPSDITYFCYCHYLRKLKLLKQDTLTQNDLLTYFLLIFTEFVFYV